MSIAHLVYFLFFLSFSPILGFQLYFFLRFLYRSKPTYSNGISENISIVVCVKNEDANLADLLDDILKQDYKNFELILVDDNSFDSSRDIMEHYLKLDSRIRIVSVPYSDHFYGSKKYALTLGIKACTHDIILFTDGDCRIPSSNWIQSMINPYCNSSVQIVLGYGGYSKTKGFVNTLTRFETLKTVLLYMSFAESNIPYMGVGRNLSYRKSLWEKTKGFSSHMNLPSGDDDLFISEASNSENCALNTDVNSFTYSLSKPNLKQWVHQKRRHITTANRYNPIPKYLLGLLYLSELILLIILPFLILMNIKNPNFYALSALGLNIILSSVIFIKSKALFKEDLNLLHLPFLKLGLVSMQMIIFIKNSITQTNRW